MPDDWSTPSPRISMALEKSNCLSLMCDLAPWFVAPVALLLGSIPLEAGLYIVTAA
jgi:hypothetical protein